MELKRLRLVLSAAAGCWDERWCAWSTRFRGRAVGRRVFRLAVSFLDVLLPDTSFRMNLVAKPGQSANWGAEKTCAKRKSTSPSVSHSCVRPHRWAQ